MSGADFIPGPMLDGRTLAADRRDHKAMLLAERLRCAGATPQQRAEWALYVEARKADYVPARNA